jgi:hypothetical protein
VKQRRGSGLVWLLAGLAFCSSIALFLQPSFPADFSRGEWVALMVCLVVTVGGLAFETVHDGFVAFRTGLWFAAALAASVTTVGLIRAGLSTLQLAVAVAATVYFALGLATWASLQFGRSPWPNLLTERHPDLPAYEVNGVQFIFRPANVKAKAGETFEFDVVAQNAVDAPRSLALELGFATPFSKGREPVVLPADPELELAAGEVAVLTVRALARQSAIGTHALRFDVSVAGSQARRMRRFRFPRYSPEAPLLLEALVVFAGVTVGLKERGIIVEILPSGLMEAQAFPKVHKQSLWRPGATN